jgi:Ca-activated chloride channel homolog
MNPARSVTRFLCTVLILLAIAAVHVVGEQAITVNVDLVNIYFTVCNKKGRLIPHLAQTKFAVSEDGKPQLITNFSRDTDSPLTIALLLDTSGSVRFKLPFERDAAIDFLQSTLRPGRDKAGIFTFDSTIDLRQDYTDDLQLLTAAVRQTRAGGGTRMYDALCLLLNRRHGPEAERRGIVLLSDGKDTTSRSSPKQVVEAAQRSNATIYAISVNSIDASPTDSRRGDEVLEMFAQETGGKAFFPRRAKDLAEYFSEISDELRSQYTIAYRPTNSKRDGTYRNIHIEVVDNPRYIVRSRSGYYAPDSAGSSLPDPGQQAIAH